MLLYYLLIPLIVFSAILLFPKLRKINNLNYTDKNKFIHDLHKKAIDQGFNYISIYDDSVFISRSLKDSLEGRKVVFLLEEKQATWISFGISGSEIRSLTS